MKQDAATIGAVTPDESLVTPGSLRDVVRVLERYRTGMDQAEVAAALGWDKPRVSKVLSRVGNQFDIDLTDRDDDNPGRLAPRVEEFLRNARQVVESYNALLRPTKFGLRKVRVGANPSTIACFLTKNVFPNLLVNDLVGFWDGRPDPFPKRFPLYQLEFLHIGMSPDVIHEIGRGRLDFGIVDCEPRGPGLAAGEFEFHPLFRSTPRGFLYHERNESFRRLAENPKRFSWEALRAHTLILSEGDTATVRDGHLPDPANGEATRVFVNTYAQVLNAVSENVGIGVGFQPKSTGDTGRVKLLPFDDIECASPQDQKRVVALQARSFFSFDVCVRKGWQNPRAEGGLTDAARFVLEAVRATAKGYTHDYVS